MMTKVMILIVLAAILLMASEHRVDAVHKKYIIHVPFKVHHEHHTKTVYKPIHHTEHEHKGDYEVLGHHKSDPYDNLLEGTHIHFSQPTHEYELEGHDDHEESDYTEQGHEEEQHYADTAHVPQHYSDYYSH